MAEAEVFRWILSLLSSTNKQQNFTFVDHPEKTGTILPKLDATPIREV